MRISAIAAMSKNFVIGKNNTMPWHMPADLKHFKKITLSKPVLMGRKTYESIGRPLPGRKNIIISRDANFHAPGCTVTTSLDTAIASVAESDEIFIIGGETLFQQMMPRTDRIYLTIIQHEFEGDTFFPQINFDEWYEVERTDHDADVDNPYAYSFLVLDRIAII